MIVVLSHQVFRDDLLHRVTGSYSEKSLSHLQAPDPPFPSLEAITVMFPGYYFRDASIIYTRRRHVSMYVHTHTLFSQMIVCYYTLCTLLLPLAIFGNCVISMQIMNIRILIAKCISNYYVFINHCSKQFTLLTLSPLNHVLVHMYLQMKKQLQRG